MDSESAVVLCEEKITDSEGTPMENNLQEVEISKSFSEDVAHELAEAISEDPTGFLEFKENLHKPEEYGKRESNNNSLQVISEPVHAEQSSEYIIAEANLTINQPNSTSSGNCEGENSSVLQYLPTNL